MKQTCDRCDSTLTEDCVTFHGEYVCSVPTADPDDWDGESMFLCFDCIADWNRFWSVREERRQNQIREALLTGLESGSGVRPAFVASCEICKRVPLEETVSVLVGSDRLYVFCNDCGAAMLRDCSKNLENPQ